MTFKLIPKYRNDAGDVVEFTPIDNVPGFSHRVIIRGRAIDYLGNHQRPSTKVAEFFFNKHSQTGDQNGPQD